MRVAAVILTRDGELRAKIEELTEEVRRRDRGYVYGCSSTYIMARLDETNWVLRGPNGAAVGLGLDRTTLLSKIRILGSGSRLRRVGALGFV